MMLDIAGVIPNTLTRLKKLAPGSGLELLTYKRDRSIHIVKSDDDAFIITESGFQENVFSSDLKSMKKLLRTLLKREFPRSNKVRVQEFS
nr:hypothetical protein [uncultured Pseudodesulfovibrio sp.]